MCCRRRSAREFRYMLDEWLLSWGLQIIVVKHLILKDMRGIQQTGGRPGVRPWAKPDSAAQHSTGSWRPGLTAKIRRQGRSPAVHLEEFKLLAAIDGLFQFGASSELGDATGGNFDSGPGLRIASIARLPLRN